MIAAWLLVAVLAVLSALQVAVACGAPLGSVVWGGRHRVLPTRLRIGSLVAVLVYACCALVTLDRAGVVHVLPETFSRVAMWVLTVWFALSVAQNAVSRSRSERAVMVPVAVVLTVLAAFVAAS